MHPIVEQHKDIVLNSIVDSLEVFKSHLAHLTAEDMESNWGGGQNYLGETWQQLATWNAGQMGGGQSYLMQTGDMSSVDHSLFLYNALINESPDYSDYPVGDSSGESYPPFHQTGGVNSRGVELPQRKWHPDDFSDYSDFDPIHVTTTMDEFEEKVLEDMETSFANAMELIAEEFSD